ncbi:MAG TPA: hypothetical protein VGJ56_07100 [Reyranella sp.]|jgi:hypothetical protein
MSICFISNKDLTVVYSDIARRLQREGEEIVWLAPSRRWANWLRDEGWPSADILCLAEHEAEWQDLPIEKAAAELADIEREAPATIGNVIHMCRNLRRSPAQFSYAYLAVARRHVEPFLRQRKVEVAFGEGTWGFELLTWLVCGHIGIPMLTPSSTRVPGDRFYFADAVMTTLFEVVAPGRKDVEWARNFLHEWLHRPVQPPYMQAFKSGYTPFHLRWLNELFIGLARQHLDRGDATLWPLSARIADRTTRFVNAIMSRYFSPFETSPPNERYVLYPLHHQPESSIDVYGSLNSNQLALIDTVSRLLPVTHRLWVKEHKGAIGDRSLGWLRQVKALPNVRLIDPFRDIFSLMKGADLVLTVSGTVAYEAALLGVSSVGLSPIFFSSLLTNKPHARSHPLEWRLREMLEAPRPALDGEPRPAAIEFLANLHANSYFGNPFEVGAPRARRAEPEYLVPEAKAFSDFLAGLRARRARP